jgi:hypothetical protein
VQSQSRVLAAGLLALCGSRLRVQLGVSSPLSVLNTPGSSSDCSSQGEASVAPEAGVWALRAARPPVVTTLAPY